MQQTAINNLKNNNNKKRSDLSISCIVLKPFIRERRRDSARLLLHFGKKKKKNSSHLRRKMFLQTAKCRSQKQGFDLFHITTGNLAIAGTNKSSQSTIPAKTKLGGRAAAKAARQPLAAARRIELNSCGRTQKQPLLSGEETFIFHRFCPHVGPNDG